VIWRPNRFGLCVRKLRKGGVLIRRHTHFEGALQNARKCLKRSIIHRSTSGEGLEISDVDGEDLVKIAGVEDKE
jgi:hypothetical protein